VGFAPAFLGKVHTRFQTPANALAVNMIIGIIALLTGKTAEIITIAVFGALTLYAISMVALIQLRKNEPHLPRPFKVPFYPMFPYIALVISVISFVAMMIYNFKLAFVYLSISGVCFVIFKLRRA
jgi:ethanolamine permease